MCSNPVPDIADIERAIDELAALAVTAIAPAGDPAAAAASEHQMVTRLARLWELLADLDPEVARRMPVYRTSRLTAAESPAASAPGA